MLLKDFVRETIVEIMEGVRRSQGSVKNYGGTVGKMNMMTQSIEFDVAVTTVETVKSEGHAGIAVLKVIGIGGTKGNELENTSVSRVKFSVPVQYPSQSAD